MSTRRGTISRRLALLALACGIACNAIVGIEDPIVVEPPRESCILNSDCENGSHVCLFETCSPPCEKDVDCARGEFCLNTEDGKGCVGTGKARCSDDDGCPSGAACFDGECRTDCRVDATACLVDQVCESDGACRGPGGGGGTGGTSGTGGSSGTGAAGAGGEGGGDGGSGGIVTPGDPCSDEGALKCSGRASTSRLVCEGGVLRAASPCDTGELCDRASDPPGECSVVPEECRGQSPGAAFCEGLTRVVCGPDLVTVEREDCPSIQHCTLATGTECAACLPNEHACRGDALDVCNESLTGFEEVEVCMGMPCNAEAGACTTFACVTGGRRCVQDRLEECNSDRSGFELVETCEAGLCDPVELVCDQCTAGATSCANGTTRRVCSDDGQSETEPACPVGSPRCTGAGVCVECTQVGDCTPTSDCYLPACNTGTGRCEFTFRGANMACDDGYCTSAGACVACTLPDHCETTRPCYTGVCRPNNTCGEDPDDLTNDPDNCGSCGTVCSSNHVTGRGCSNSTCTGSCQSGWQNCNSDLQQDGCETNTAGDVGACGGCTTVCSTNHVTNRTCTSGVCSATCVSPWLNCDGNMQTNGCETDSGNSPTNCGGCGSNCTYGYCENQLCAFRRWGVYSPGPNSENRGANTLQGMQIPINATTTVKALGIRTGSIIGTPHVRLALYRDSGGAPQQLVAQTGELTAVLNGATEGPVTPAAISPGTYWVFLLTDVTLRITTLAITSSWWIRTPHTYAAFPATLPGLTSMTLAEGNLYVVTTP